MADLQHVANSLQIIANEAGLYMLGAVDAERDSEEKTNSKDFVTIADIKSQNLISAGLRRVFPDIQVISEEDSEELRAMLYDTRFTGFVIDPIDGTYKTLSAVCESQRYQSDILNRAKQRPALYMIRIRTNFFRRYEVVGHTATIKGSESRITRL